MYVFSKTTLSFYPVALKEDYQAAGSWPEDGVEVTEEVFNTFNQEPPSGKQRGADASGQPVWTDIPLPDISIARESKIAEINAWRNEKENSNYILRFKEKNWDYSKITQQRMEMAVDIAKESKLPEGFFWTDADNNDVPMNNQELIALSQAIAAAMFTKGLEIHIRQRQMKGEINKMTNVTEIIHYIPDWKKEGA